MRSPLVTRLASAALAGLCSILHVTPRSGERLWRFHTVPEPGGHGIETWEEESWGYTGNTNVWTPFTADLELGYVYLPVAAERQYIVFTVGGPEQPPELVALALP